MSVVESVNIFFSSNPTKTAGKDNRDDKQDNDSTASSPVVKQRDHSRRLPATERKTRKSNILETLRASSSAPPKSNLKGRTDDRDFKEIRKNLFCRPDEEDDSDFYLNYHPAASIGYEGLDINFHIPSWMPMTFKPTAAMNLNDLCAYTAAYIFKADPEQLFGDEVLVRTTSGVIGDRQALKSLMPRYPVDQQIINLVVARQNWVMSITGRVNTIWYMPTEFQQYALETHQGADYVREIYQAKFMTPGDYVNRMFIPMNDQGSHWYLMVVDFNQRKLVWLDSLHCASRDHFRRRAILRMVNTATRMKLAIHLVKAANNELYDEVLAKAAESWRAEEERRKNLVKI
ncbi:unnamed protein product [Trifolium pratense]|uniref:Uncharacterized protein n=1 Tax=Trifolium pratense TaxID=57577 RepID=A0ACB0JJD0_TRIPR|nr:unnamed protein product [Trifolium pratense]